MDDADVTPPTAVIGNALRATGHTTSTVDFEWPTAPALGAGAQYVVLRSDDQPDGPLAPIGLSPVLSWTDPDAPPTYTPAHVWFYRVAVADECGNFALE